MVELIDAPTFTMYFAAQPLAKRAASRVMFVRTVGCLAWIRSARKTRCTSSKVREERMRGVRLRGAQEMVREQIMAKAPG
jgi:hypothetical protein